MPVIIRTAFNNQNWNGQCQMLTVIVVYSNVTKQLLDRSHAPAWECSSGRSSVLYALATRRWSGSGSVTTLERGNDKNII